MTGCSRKGQQCNIILLLFKPEISGAMTQEFLEEFGKQLDRHEKWDEYYSEGIRFIDTNECKKAITLLEKALELSDSEDVVHLAMCVERLAYAHQLEGNTYEAEGYYKQAIDFCDVDPFEIFQRVVNNLHRLPEEYEKLREPDIYKQKRSWLFSFKQASKRILGKCQENYGKLLENQNRTDDLNKLTETIQQIKNRVAKISY